MHLQAWFAQVLLHALNERGPLILGHPCITSIDQQGHLHTHIVLHSIIHTFPILRGRLQVIIHLNVSHFLKA